MLPERPAMRNREQSDVFLPAVRVHRVLDVNADRARALVQNRELRLMIEESGHLQKVIAPNQSLL